MLLGGADADTLTGNEGMDAVSDATSVINEAFAFSAALLSALEA